MPSPGASQSLMRPDLRDAVAEEWDANGEAENYIADRVGARIDIDAAAATLKRIPREMFTKDPNSVDRGAGGEYSESTLGDETFAVFTKEQGHQMKVDSNMAAQTKRYYDAEMVAARIVLAKLKRMHEKAVAAAVFNTTTFTGAALTTNVSTNWTSAPTTAVPITDVQAAKAKVRANCGRIPNSIIMSWSLFQAVLENTQIINRINGGATRDMPARARLAALAELFELDNVIVAGGIKDSAKQGQAFVAADIWAATQAMVCYINPRPSLLDVNLCNVYNWEGDGGSWDFTFESFRDEIARGDYVRGRRQVGIKAEYPECGHLLTNVG